MHSSSKTSKEEKWTAVHQDRYHLGTKFWGFKSQQTHKGTNDRTGSDTVICSDKSYPGIPTVHVPSKTALPNQLRSLKLNYTTDQLEIPSNQQGICTHFP